MADEILDDDTPAEPIELSRFDMHSAWRVLLWGASAAMAVAIVAGTAFSDVGAERLQQTVAALFEPAKNIETPAQTPQQQQVAQQPTQTVTPQQLAALEKQTRDLAKSVHELTTDRDLLKAKLASVEQNLDDITGAIKKRTAQTTAQPAAPKEAAVPPVISAPQTIAAIPSPSANPAVATIDTPITTAATPPAIEPSVPLEGPIPLPPMRTAALEEPAAAAIRELGIDVGGAASLDGLRAHWAALKANIGPDIVGLSPSFAVRQKPAGGSDYRLVLGPLPNAATAFRICTKLIAARINCRTGTFSVQRLTEAASPPTAPARKTEQLPPWTRESTILR